MFRPTLISLLLAGALLAGGATAAQAQIAEIGATGDNALSSPACPSDPCVAVTRTTGYQLKVGGKRLYTVPANGRLVAWSITLAKPTADQVSFYEQNFGGSASAGLAIVRSGRHLHNKTVRTTGQQELTDYFGTTVQFPLFHSVHVLKGDIIALNVPTWAPALAVANLGNNTSWRASRTDNCNDSATSAMQTVQKAGQVTEFRCLYRTARLTYTATLVTKPGTTLADGKKQKSSHTGGGKRRKKHHHR